MDDDSSFSPSQVTDTKTPITRQAKSTTVLLYCTEVLNTSLLSKIIYKSSKMKFSSLCLTFALLGTATVTVTAEQGSCSQGGLTNVEAPFVAAKMMLHGAVKDPENTDELADVAGCCAMEKMEEDVCSSGNLLTGSIAPQVIGQIPQMTQEQTLQVLEDAKAGWKGGSGVWPQMSLKERIGAIEKFIVELRTKREEIVVTLMWEIGKNRKDAEAEFDRTMAFVQKVKREKKDKNSCCKFKVLCYCGYLLWGLCKLMHAVLCLFVLGH
jgi:hypothetical protein